MNILVTGSSGTIGTRLCEKFLEVGHQVVGVDWVPNKWKPSVQAITQIADLRSDEAIASLKLPAKIDALIHLAANARVYELVEDPVRARDNMVTTFNALELARTHKIPRVIFASSREVYGNAKAPKYTEDMVHVDLCESPYTASKIAGEALVEAYTRCYDVAHVILRFSNVYGMYDESNRVIPLFIRQTRDKKPLTVFGEGKCLDFTYIDDTVSGIGLALEKFESVSGQTFNLAYGEGHTILELAKLVQELMGNETKIELAPARRGEVTMYVADISKARRLLGYDPKVHFDEGVKKTVEWYKAHSR